jgi:predicted nicotinamide N-methyase
VPKDTELAFHPTSTLEADTADLDLLRADAFERSYAMRWLTTVISHASSFEMFDRESCGLPPDDSPRALLVHQYDVILTSASALLAICAGPSAAGAFTRNFVFSSMSGDITVILTDAPLENQNFASVGAQTWGGACVLSELIVERPSVFGLVPQAGQGKCIRALELGAGTGLVSLVLSKLLQNMGIYAEIVATDFYPSVLVNLRSNIATNCARSSSSMSLTSHFLDWSSFPDLEVPSPPFDYTFDIIFGADIIYEATHALWIKSCLQKLLHRPETLSSLLQPAFHLVIPLRPTHAMECRTIEEVFPSVSAPGPVPFLGSSDLVLVILEKELITCEAGEGRREDEVEYEYYKIGWGVA